ncbi:hypothetical protein ADL26_00850 [Thermoactinomyces vulgaris]|nr:hypothetical protein ADL26_00850 [Thermoactinomyces vulgaris]
MKSRVSTDFILLFIAFVWGATFVIVQDTIHTLPPFWYLTIRFSLAAAVLLIFAFRADHTKYSINWQHHLLSGSILGFFLFAGYALQTFSLFYTTSGKSGFLTGISVALVPFLAKPILKTEITPNGLIGVTMAVIGLYLLAFTDFQSINAGDLLAFLCAIFFALQIVYTGKYSPLANPLLLVAIQLSAVSLLSFVSALQFEPWQEVLHADILFNPLVLVTLLITSLLATTLAFIAQTHVQKVAHPTRVALIFAMEPVFAALADYVWFGTKLSWRAMLGCLCILAGMIVAELPRSLLHRHKRTQSRSP